MAAILSRPQCVNIVNTQYIKWFYRALICYGSIIVKDFSARKVTQKDSLTSMVPNHGKVWTHDDVIKWKHSVLLGICAGNSSVTGEFPTQRPVTRNLVFSLICAWINAWVNNREAGDLRRHCAHYDVIVMHVRIFLDVWPIQRLSYPCSVEVEMILVITRIIIDM